MKSFIWVAWYSLTESTIPTFIRKIVTSAVVVEAVSAVVVAATFAVVVAAASFNGSFSNAKLKC